MSDGFHILTFGCQMNVNDSDWLSRALIREGLKPVPLDQARVVVVNTCSVRDKPEQKVYSVLGRLRPGLEKRGGFAVVAGCVAQQIGLGFHRRFPFVRLVVGTDGLRHAPQAIARVLREPGLRLSLLDFSEEFPDASLDGLTAEDIRGRGAKAFVNIMQGCDNFCAYCIVPFVRGRQKSRPSADILAECSRLAELGCREITLLGQNVNSYGLDKHGDGASFSQLLRRVATIPGVERLRFVTSHPKDMDDDVVRAFGELPNLCPSLHLPLQSGSDRILKAMGRRYDLARYLDLVDRLRAQRPDILLTTDLIVGFPGETEEDFEATLEAMRTARFGMSFSFCYSDRPGTRAEKLPDKLPNAIKVERLERLQALQDHLTQELLAPTIGQTVEVLIEGASKKSNQTTQCAGHDIYGRVVNLQNPGELELVGKAALVRITEFRRHSLIGQMTGEPW